MMKYEFEKLANIEVSEYDYTNVIEPMYMATNLSKEEFVQTLNLKRFALRSKKQLISTLKKIAKRIKENCMHFTDYEAFKEAEHIVQELRERFDKYTIVQYDWFYSCPYLKCLLIGSEKIDLLN